MTELMEAYPLYWPEGRPRLPRYSRQKAKFDTSFARARDNIVREVKLLTNSYREPTVIISTNLPLRHDGLPLASAKKVDDPAVAVYFTYKDRQRCFACDRWDAIEDNMQAICKTIEALRGIARWGTGDMLEAAFTGFTALPSNKAKRWTDVLGFPPDVTVTADQVRAKYRELVAIHHPDRGGSHARMAEINAARDEALRGFA
jgi:hypothetical protein